MEDFGRSEMKEFARPDVKEEVEHILQLARSRGFHLYMKDHNWLGFPVVMVFIPELNIGRRLWLPSGTVDRFKDRLLADPFSIGKDDLQILEKPEFILNIQARLSLSEFFEIDTLTLERWSTWEFFGLLALAFGLTELARQYLRHVYYDIPDSRKARTDSLHREEILRELVRALPDCRKPCTECRFIKECKYTVLGDFESTLVKSYPDSLRRTEPVL
jgi:hypothetical protein